MLRIAWCPYIPPGTTLAARWVNSTPALWIAAAGVTLRSFDFSGGGHDGPLGRRGETPVTATLTTPTLWMGVRRPRPSRRRSDRARDRPACTFETIESWTS